MHKALHGAIMGLLIGGPAVLLAYTQVTSAVDQGTGPVILWIIGYVVWGAILGYILPKHK